MKTHKELTKEIRAWYARHGYTAAADKVHDIVRMRPTEQVAKSLGIKAD